MRGKFPKKTKWLTLILSTRTMRPTGSAGPLHWLDWLPTFGVPFSFSFCVRVVQAQPVSMNERRRHTLTFFFPVSLFSFSFIKITHPMRGCGKFHYFLNSISLCSIVVGVVVGVSWVTETGIARPRQIVHTVYMLQRKRDHLNFSALKIIMKSNSWTVLNGNDIWRALEQTPVREGKQWNRFGRKGRGVEEAWTGWKKETKNDSFMAMFVAVASVTGMNHETSVNVIRHL